jgi:hypothetical protein
VRLRRPRPTEWAALALALAAGAIRQLGHRVWEKLSVGRLALVLGGVAGCAVIFAATTNVLETWLPEIATSAASIAITITVVDKLVLRERREREAARRDAAYRRLVNAFVTLTIPVSMDYIATHRHTDVEFPHEPVEVMSHWLRDEEDTARRTRGDGSPPFVAAAAFDFAETVQRVLEADRDVVADDLRAALTEVVARRAEDIVRTHGIPPEQSDPAYLWMARRIFEAVLAAAIALREERPKDWASTWGERMLTLQAVERDELSL